MAGRKKRGAGSSSSKGGSKAKAPSPPHYDHFIEFTPEGGFNIRTAARNFSNLMEHSNQPLIIHLPHVSVEFEPGCTPKEIIDGYNQALRAKFVVKPSNTNAKAT
jgi:hypothetical protein